MRKLSGYSNPESIQLSPAPQRDLFTGKDRFQELDEYRLQKIDSFSNR